jgi:DNA-binding response OmpR family regulator
VASRPKVLRAADLALDPANYEVSRAGKEIALNRTEFRLLKSLMKRAGRVIFRKTLFHSIWNSNDDVDENLLDVTISHLRKKVDRNHEVKLIRTVRNVGYYVRDPAKTQ